MRRFTLLIALLLAALTSLAIAQDTDVGVGPEDRGPLVAVATTAFRIAESTEGSEARTRAFGEAAALYEQALASGPPNGALEFNAANAWYLAGNDGLAILHYRRGLLVRPGDARIEANLETARARRRDQLDGDAGRAVIETIAFWHRGLSIRAKTTLSLAAWAAGLLALAAALLVRSTAATRGLVRGGVVAVVIALAVGISAVVEASERARRDGAVVLADEVVLRTGDGETYPARYENPLHAGAEVRIVEERAGWTELLLPDGKQGWVPGDTVERL